MSDEDTNTPPPPPPGMMPPPPPPPAGMDTPPPPPPGMGTPPPPPPAMGAAPPPPPAPPMGAAPPPPPAPPMDAAPPAPPMDAAPPAPPMDAAPPPPPLMDAPPPPAPPMDAAPPAPPADSLSSAADLLGGLSIDSDDADDSEDDADALLESATANLDLLAPPAPPVEEEAPAEPEAAPSVDLLTPAAPEISEMAETDAAEAEDSDSEDDAQPDIMEEPADDGVDHAGAGVRPLSEVDEIAGDKLEGSLHEIENSVLSVAGEVVDQKVDGVLAINNPSEKDRLWDIDVFMNNLTATDFDEGHIPIQELEAGKDNTRKYSVAGPNMLTVREIIDTKPDREQQVSTSAVCSEEVLPMTIRIEVENVGPVSLHDVEVTRTIPEQMTIADGDLHTISKNGLAWSVGTIEASATRTLELTAELLTENIDEVDAGSTVATYRADATLSGLSITELDAYCRGFSYMKVREDERPDNWKCQAVFENRSSFAVDLVKLQVKQAGSDDYLFNISDVEKDVGPDGRWESGVAIVMATDDPVLNQDMDFTVIPRVTHSTEGTLELEQYTIQVLEADVEKNYSAEVLRTYREAHVNAEITIKNTGTAPINLLRLTDDIPGIFNSPDTDQIECTIEGNELVRDQINIDVKEGVTLETEALSPDGPGNTMLMTIGKKGPVGLEPGQTMTITYPLIAADPTPGNDTVVAPLKADFSAERYGPVATREVAEPPAIRVIHKRRKFDTGKEVFPAGGAGRYEVLIMFQNKSDSALQDLIIHDVVPPEFEIKGYNIRSDSGVREADMEKADDENGVKVSWHIPVIEKDERIEVIYELVGDSSAEYKVSRAKDFRGATFGDELDVDLPPAPPEEEEPEPEEAEEEATDEEAGDDESTEEDVTDEDSDEDDGGGDEDDSDGSDEEADESSEEDEGGDDDDAADDDESESDENGDEGGDADDEDAAEEEPSENEEAEMDAALAQITGGDAAAEVEAESEPAEAEPEEAEPEPEEAEAESQESSSATCPICSSAREQGANVCSTCSFEFE